MFNLFYLLQSFILLFNIEQVFLFFFIFFICVFLYIFNNLIGLLNIISLLGFFWWLLPGISPQGRFLLKRFLFLFLTGGLVLF